MVYNFKVHKEDAGGYWAECIELEGCYTQADTLDQLAANAKDALNLFLSEPYDSDVVFPMPKKLIAKKSGPKILRVGVEPRVGLAMSIRQARVKKHLSQRKASQLLGYKSVFAYQKLESAKTCNPEFATLVALKKHFDFDVDTILDVV